MRRLSLVGALWLPACYDAPLPPPPEVAVADLNTEFVAQAWALELDSVEARAAFDSMPGWVLLHKQDAGGALDYFGRSYRSIDRLPEEEAGRVRRGLARSHLVLSAILRHVALAAAHSYIHSYKPGPRVGTDPVETDYLLGLSHGIAGNCDESAKALHALPEGTSVDRQSKAWLEWAESDACPRTVGPTDASLFPADPGAVVPGARPGVGVLPHYEFASVGIEDDFIKVGDPSTLLMLAEWHLEAAKEAAPDGETEIVAALDSLWRLPGRAPRGAASGDIDIGWTLFGMTLSEGDIDFLNEAVGEGAATIETWLDQSLMATVLHGALVEGHIDPETLDQLGGQLRTELTTRLEEREGAPHRSHGNFSDLAPLSLFRAGLRINDATAPEWHAQAGVMGMALYDQCWDGPVHLHFAQFQAEWTAWKAGTGSTWASELLHRMSGEYPEVEGARYALDMMNLRVQSNSISEGASQ